jgi:uncharacterized membrane protein YagU involved in acid resistance
MKTPLSKIIKAGLIVGTLDIVAAFIQFFIQTKNNPLIILKYIASGILGKEAFSGGGLVILLGLILHYIIAFSFTILFFWLFTKIKILSRSKIITGILYGIFIWVVMNLIVVPLSNIPARPFDIVNAIINAVILIVCIGIPLSFMANKFYRKNTETGSSSSVTDRNSIQLS